MTQDDLVFELAYSVERLQRLIWKHPGLYEKLGVYRRMRIYRALKAAAKIKRRVLNQRLTNDNRGGTVSVEGKAMKKNRLDDARVSVFVKASKSKVNVFDQADTILKRKRKDWRDWTVYIYENEPGGTRVEYIWKHTARIK